MNRLAQMPIRAIAVDLANLCLKSDPRVRMGTTERPPLLFSDILDIMRDLEALQLTVPIFHLIDHSVEPYGMTADETRQLRKMEQKHPSDPRKIWRMGGRSLRHRRKADDAICTLVNNRSVAVITDDQLRPEIEAGRLRDPSRLVRFEAWRANRDEPFRFYNPREQWDIDLARVVDRLSPDQQVAEWAASARLIASHLGGAAKRDTKRLVNNHLMTDRVSHHEVEEATPEEVEKYQDQDNEPSSHASSIWDKLRELAPVATRPTKSAPAIESPAKQVTRTPESTFIFLKQADLKTHQNRYVEIIARTFVNNDVVEFGMYASRRPLRLEFDVVPDVKTSHEFSSAVGFLELDGRGWVLRNATWLGPVSLERRNAVMSGSATWTPPTFKPWGSRPRRRPNVVKSPEGLKADAPSKPSPERTSEAWSSKTTATPQSDTTPADHGTTQSKPQARERADDRKPPPPPPVSPQPAKPTVVEDPVSAMTPLSWGVVAAAVLARLLQLLS